MQVLGGLVLVGLGGRPGRGGGGVGCGGWGGGGAGGAFLVFVLEFILHLTFKTLLWLNIKIIASSEHIRITANHDCKSSASSDSYSPDA